MAIQQKTSTVRSVAAAASVIGLSVIAPMAGAACAPKSRCAAKVAKCGACKAKCGACAAKCGACKAKCGACAAKCKAKCGACAAKCGACKAKCGACAAKCKAKCGACAAKCGACKAKCGACAAKCGACKPKCGACRASKCGACGAKCGACGAGGKIDVTQIQRPAGYVPIKATNGLVARGWKLFKDTTLSTNGLACNTCHIGNSAYNDTFSSPYPHFVQMAKDRAGMDQVHADEMVQLCMVIPMANKPLAWNSRDLAALTAYVEKVRTTTFKGAVGGGAKCGACGAKCGARKCAAKCGACAAKCGACKAKCGACAPKCGACKPKCKAG